MNMYFSTMGCAQTSRDDASSKESPIEQLNYNKDDSKIPSSRVNRIISSPMPMPLKSVLKHSDPDGKRKNERLSLLKQKPTSVNRSVDFDEQVLVIARTPTPNKIWYEKQSLTMPIREYPRNDDDDDDDDDRDGQFSSSEEQENDKQINSESSMARLPTPTLLLRRDQNNHLWYKSEHRKFYVFNR